MGETHVELGEFYEAGARQDTRLDWAGLGADKSLVVRRPQIPAPNLKAERIASDIPDDVKETSYHQNHVKGRTDQGAHHGHWQLAARPGFRAI